MKRILFIAVHPDDETLGCGGTIIKNKLEGNEIYWLIITASSTEHPFGFKEDRVLQRNKEIDKVASKYGFNKVFNLRFPTQLLDEVNLRDLIVKIDEVIFEIKPNHIYIQNRSDVHSDHRISFNAIYACTKNFRKPFIDKILMYETLSETEFSAPLSENNFQPNVFVDITDYMPTKLDIMKIYESEVMDDNYPRSYNTIKALGTFRGSRIGVKYAESFMLLFEKIL